MPVTNWTTAVINGKTYLVIDVASFRIPLDWDPSSNMFIAVAAPDGAIGNFPALVKGDKGDPATIDTDIDFHPLAYDDPTADSASWVDLGGNEYQLSLYLHKGATGEAGGTELHTASDLDVGSGLVAGRLLVVNDSADGFIQSVPKVGDMYWPASIASTPSGNSAYTLCSVAVPAQGFDWRPHIEGWCVITGTGEDVQVDLIARLNNATSGNELGRATQPAGQYPATHHFASGPPAGSADGYNRIAAGAGPTTIYCRVERQSGAATFTTSNTTTRFGVEVRPVP